MIYGRRGRRRKSRHTIFLFFMGNDVYEEDEEGAAQFETQELDVNGNEFTALGVTLQTFLTSALDVDGNLFDTNSIVSQKFLTHESQLDGQLFTVGAGGQANIQTQALDIDGQLFSAVGITSETFLTTSLDADGQMFSVDSMVSQDFLTSSIDLDGQDFTEVTGTTVASNAMVMEFVIATNNETLTIPCYNTATYSATIAWGDGNESVITTYNDADLAHTYEDSGTYDVTITGEIGGIFFDDTGDKLKLTGISSWGDLGFKTCKEAYRGCSNLIVSASSFTGMGLSKSFFRMLSNCTNFNAPFTGVDTSSATDMSYMLFYCTSFNQDLSPLDMNGVTNIQRMLLNCTSFDQSLAAWDISTIQTMTQLLNGGGISTSNYDATLISWEGQSYQSSVSVDFGSSTYTAGGDAATARANLVSTGSWTIIDGGTA